MHVSFPYGAPLAPMMKALETVQGGARVRVLTETDLRWARKAAKRARAWAKRVGLAADDVTVLVRHIVPSSYNKGRGGGATNLSLRDSTWQIARGKTTSRSHGRGEEYVVRVAVPVGFHALHPVTKRSVVERYRGGYAYLRT